MLSYSSNKVLFPRPHHGPPDPSGRAAGDEAAGVAGAGAGQQGAGAGHDSRPAAAVLLQPGRVPAPRPRLEAGPPAAGHEGAGGGEEALQCSQSVCRHVVIIVPPAGAPGPVRGAGAAGGGC